LSETPISVGILGAGIAGLACARVLVEAGVATCVFDKGRKPGGRMTTRRVGGVAFDDGAQYATARDPGFAAWLRTAAAAGHAAAWDAATDGRDTRWVGTPGMSALPAGLASSLPEPVRCGRHAGFLHRDDDGWWVRHLPAEAIRPGEVADTGGELAGPFAAVLLAMPAPQAAALLRTAAHPFAEAAAGATYAPCWAATVAFADRVEAPDTQRHTIGPLRWTAREASRPGHATSPDAWVLHASPEWSWTMLECNSDAIAAELLAAFRSLTGASASTILAARRWRYALVETPLGQDCLWDAASKLGACGDWCVGGRVEAAWQSGCALARRVLGRP
jgi:predicted NAD/FAD-dependent oxidoreductase